MNDWLHCNKCNMKHQSDIKMYLVECAHVFCEKCINRVSDGKCLLCGKSNNFILIEKDMHSSAQPFFMPLEVQIKKTMEVYNFQMLHKQRLCQVQAEKYQFAKRELFNCHNKMKGLLTENRMMRNMLLNNSRSSHSNQGGFITSTPSIANEVMSPFSTVVSTVAPMTPIMKKSRPGYAQRLPAYENNARGMPMSQKQQHMLSGGGYYRPSPGVMGPPNMSQHRRMDMVGVHGIHKTSTTSNSMSELQSKRT